MAATATAAQQKAQQELLMTKSLQAHKVWLELKNLLGGTFDIAKGQQQEKATLTSYTSQPGKLQTSYTQRLESIVRELINIKRQNPTKLEEAKAILQQTTSEIRADLEAKENYCQEFAPEKLKPSTATASTTTTPAATTASSTPTAAAASATATSSTAAAAISAKTTAIIAKLKSTTTSEDPSIVATTLERAQTELAIVDSSITEINQQLTVLKELQQKLTAKLAKTTTAKPQLETIITELTARQEALKTKSTAATATIPPEKLEEFQLFLEWQRMQAASTAAAATTSPAPAAPASASLISLGDLPSLPPSAH